MATYNMSCNLKIWRLRIEWRPPAPQAPNGETPPPQPPGIKLSPVTTESDCFPPSMLSNETDGLSLEPRIHVPSLTHFEFLPAEPERVHADKTFPTLLGVFHEFVAPSSVDDILGDAGRPYRASATCCLWELKAGPPPKLSDAFDTLSGKKRPLSSFAPHGQQWKLHQKAGWSSNMAILHVVSLRFNTVLAVAYADGNIEFRDRSTVSVIVAQQNPDEIHTLMQAGFTFFNSTPSLHLAFSPNYCLAATIRDHEGDETKDSGRIKIRKMEFLLGNLDRPTDDATNANAEMLSNAAVALALHHSCACGQLCTTDDLFAMLGPNVHSSLVHGFLHQAMRAMNLNLDYSTDEAHKNAYFLFRVPALYKTLSAQAALGTAKDGTRNISAKLAWITLNLKLLATSMTLSLRPNETMKLGMSPTCSSVSAMLIETELAHSLVGHIKYSLDILVYLFQDLYDVSRDLQGKERNLEAIQSKADETNSPAVAVILASVPRVLIRTVIRSIKNAYIHFINCMKAATTPEQKAEWHRVSTPFRDTPLLPLLQQQHLDTFIKEIDNAVKQCYTSPSGSGGPISTEERSRTERDLFITAKVPPILGPAVNYIFEKLLPKLGGSLDPYRIYSHDIAWLGLAEDAHSRLYIPASYELSLRSKRSGEGSMQSTPSTTSGKTATDPANTAAGTKPEPPPTLRATRVPPRSSAAADGVRQVPMVDVIRKVPLREGVTIRRCTRCGSVSEELPWGPGMQQWVVQNYKACVCSCSWACA